VIARSKVSQSEKSCDVPTKRVARQLGVSPKTVRRYLRAAASAGLSRDAGAVSDDQMREVHEMVVVEVVKGQTCAGRQSY
jgi:DeoR/GlpR family transcriptional regulator of sugar metabolism